MVGRVFSADKQKQGPDISSSLDLDSDIYNPRYGLRMEFRDPVFTQTSTLLLKIYTIERFTKELRVVGYAALNLFCLKGTADPPLSDDNATAVSLNEGAHQLRLYAFAAPRDAPLTMATMSEVRGRWRGI